MLDFLKTILGDQLQFIASDYWMAAMVSLALMMIKMQHNQKYQDDLFGDPDLTGILSPKGILYVWILGSVICSAAWPVYYAYGIVSEIKKKKKK